MYIVYREIDIRVKGKYLLVCYNVVVDEFFLVSYTQMSTYIIYEGRNLDRKEYFSTFLSETGRSSLYYV